MPSLSTDRFLLFNLFHVTVKANLSFCRETYYSETDNNTEVVSIYCSQCRKKGKEKVQSDYSLIKKYLKLERELATVSNVLIKLGVLYIIIYFLSQNGRIRGFLLSWKDQFYACHTFPEFISPFLDSLYICFLSPPSPFLLAASLLVSHTESAWKCPATFDLLYQYSHSQSYERGFFLLSQNWSLPLEMLCLCQKHSGPLRSFLCPSAPEMVLYKRATWGNIIGIPSVPTDQDGILPGFPSA